MKLERNFDGGTEPVIGATEHVAPARTARRHSRRHKNDGVDLIAIMRQIMRETLGGRVNSQQEETKQK
jgi:hypothetical protein